VIAAVYAVMVGAFLWPVPIRLTSTIYGYGGDGYGLIYEISIGRSRPQAYWQPKAIERLSFPFGYVDSNWTRVVSFIPDLFVWPVSRIFGAVAAYNLLIVVGLLGTALAACWLFSYVTRSRHVGAWAGFVFALFPFIQQSATAWPSFTHMYWLPLIVLASFNYRDRPSIVHLLAIPALAIAALLTNAYVGFMAIVVVVACSVLWAPPLVSQFRALPTIHRRRIATASISAATLAMIMLVGFVVALRGSVDRPLSDLDTYGLRLTELVRPSYLHRFASQWIQPLEVADFHGSNSSETAQFIGWSTFVLAIIGFTSPRSGAREGHQRLLAVVGILLGLVMAMSQVVYLAVLPAPARLLHEFAPFFRVYSRFGVVIFLFVLLLAAQGVAVLLRGRSSTTRLLIVSGLAGLAFVELWAPLPGRYSAVEREAFPSAIGEQPGAVVALYPIARSDSGYFYNQLIWSLDLPDGARLVNGGPVDGEGEGFRDQIRSLNSLQTWSDLSSSGVDYVVVDEARYASLYGGPPSVTRGTAVFDDGDFTVYRLRPVEAPMAWTSGDQFPAEVQLEGPSWRWIGSDSALSVRSEVDACVLVTGSVSAPDGNLAFTVVSRERPVVTIREDDDDPPFELLTPVSAGTTRFDLVPDRQRSPLSETDDRISALLLSDLTAKVVDDARCR